MTVHIKVFPIAGVCDQSQKLDISLEQGNLTEALSLLEVRLGVCFSKPEKLMLMHNGRGLDRRKNTVLEDGDQLWLLPLLSGG